MRILLASLVLVVQAAGPWLCCCLPRAVAASLAPAATEPDDCPCCRDASEPAEPVDCRHGGHTCRFPGVTLDEAIRTLIEPADDLAAADPPAGWVEVVAVPAVAPVQPSALRGGPLLPAETRLYVHHALRC